MQKGRKSDSRQSLALVGVALLIVSAVMIFYALKLPRVYEAGVTTPITTGTALQSAEIQEAPSVFPININTATVEELTQIEGLGETKAAAIVEYRDVLGGYTEVSQIMQIRGFSEGLYSRIAPYLTV